MKWITTMAFAKSSATISSFDAAVVGPDPDQAGVGNVRCRDLFWSGRGDHVHRVGLADSVAAR
jgi:hypothetical protein